ncbi:MAG: hypothetical protein K2O17_01975, partial [Bacteroidaceae bacterium]|nr:hypothetical protein [Bacteroidaceae bacterium]
MNLEDDGVVQLVPNPDNPEGDSMYVVRQSGNANVEPIKIDEIRITAPTINDIDSKIYLYGLQPQSTPKHKIGKHDVHINIDGFPLEIQDATYSYTIKPEDNANQSLEGAEAKGISADVVSIERIRFGEVKINLTINTDFPDYFPYMHLDNLALTLPEELHVTSCKLGDKPVTEITPGHIVITGTEDEARSTKGITLEMEIDELKTGKNFIFDGEKHTAILGGVIEVGGTFRVETAELDIPKLEQFIKNAENNITIDPLNPQLDLNDIGLIPDYITLNGKTTFSNDLVITHVTGTFQHAIENIDPLSLSDLPEFLMDNEEEGREVVLDLDNPMIFLSIDNSLPAEIKTSLTLKSDTDTDLNNNPIAHSTGVLTIQGNTLNEYYLAEKPGNNFLPEDHKGAKWEEVEGLSNLIKRIPEQITVEIATVTLEATDLDITKEYPIDIAYDVYAPLMFGEDFKLVYTDTDKGWNLGDDYDYLDAECIRLTANVSSNLPASMTLSFDLLNTQGHKIDIIEDNDIPPFKADKKTPIEIQIKAKPGHSLKEILSPGANQLDGIRYKAKLDEPKVGQPLQD